MVEESYWAWNHCKKDSYHRNFIPISNFNLKDLPRKERTIEQFNAIKSIADLTVRLRVNKISPARPNLDPEHIGPGTGTGMVFKTQIDPRWGIFVNCERKWFVDIHTAAHVVYNTEEAEFTLVDFFYDTEQCRLNGTVKTLWGCKVLEANFAEDWSVLRCVTDDEVFISRLSECIDKQEESFNKCTRNIQTTNLGWIYLVMSNLIITFLSVIRFEWANYLIYLKLGPSLVSDQLGFLFWPLYLLLGCATDILFSTLSKKLPIPNAVSKLPTIAIACLIIMLSYRVASQFKPALFSVCYFMANLVNLQPIDLSSLTTLLFGFLVLIAPLLHTILKPPDLLLGSEVPAYYVVWLMPLEIGVPILCILLLIPFLHLLVNPKLAFDLELPVLPLLHVIDVIFILPTVPLLLYLPNLMDFEHPFLLVTLALFILPVVLVVLDMTKGLTVVIISHPHGKPKHVTIGGGALLYRLPSLSWADTFLYKADTCSGSSGACVLYCYRGQIFGAKGTVHHGTRRYWNLSSRPVKLSPRLPWFVAYLLQNKDKRQKMLKEEGCGGEEEIDTWKMKLRT